MFNAAEVAAQFGLPILDAILIRFGLGLAMAAEVVEEGDVVTRGGCDRGASIC
jgi:hypothetical protein